MNLKHLNNDITDVLARGLHNLENLDKVNAMRSAAEVNAALEGAIDRYLNDPFFHAKVVMLVAAVMERVSSHAAAVPEGVATAWVATGEKGSVLHFAKADGWQVEIVSSGGPQPGSTTK